MKRHLVILVFGSVVNLILYQHTWAQQQLAQDAYAIFEASCLNCHGPDGAFRETLLIEHSELIDEGTVVPGDPDASELYKRLLGPTENGAQMPFGQGPLPVQSIDTVRRWILAGAPDWAATTTPLRRFITPREILTSIESHLNSLSSFDRPFARYFTMTHLYNSGITPEILAEYRKALSKLINSLSWRLKITNPQPIDPQETIFFIDLRHYEWDRNDGWMKIEQEYPYHISFDAPAHLALRNQLGRLQTSTKTDVPSVHIDWFIATASAPPLYDDLLSLPSSVQELETRLEVDVARNLRDAPGIEVWRAGLKNSGVSNHNRVVERHTSRYGAYWKSYDFAGSVGTRDIIVHPFNFTHDGGEIIFNLPNGLQGYYLVDGNGIQLGEAPISIVSNPAASDPTVRNGISCIGCHTEGMKTFEDVVRSAIEGNPNPPFDIAHALRLYVEKSVMDVLVAEDMEKYRVALEVTGGTFSGVEPVSRFHEAFHGPIGAAYAAAVVGLQTDTFLERVRENTGLQNVGLLVLDNADGSVKRDTWTSSFQDVIHALDYPRDVGDVPVETRPDLLPGRPVSIPDTNLKAVLEETLDTKRLTADDMAKLTILRGKDKGIVDLTGLEYAVNLEEVWLSDSEVSDLSPISRCTKLKRLGFWDTSITDLSPLENLIHLEQLECRASITDISPIVKLTKLKRLLFYGGNITDVTPIANMTQLTHLRFRHNGVSDISVFARFPQLEWLDLHNNKLTDISPLRNLTKMRELIISGNSRLSDISPLARLVNLDMTSLGGNNISDISALRNLNKLRRLYISDNNISDVSPLARLESLEVLKIRDNNISDFSPIDNLREQLREFEWSGNPGYPNIGYTITPTRIGEGSRFVLDIIANNVSDLAGWQFDVIFRPNMLEAVSVTEGDFMQSDGGTTFFQGGNIDNRTGKIKGIVAGRITQGGVSGSGPVVKIAFKALSKGETRVTLRNMRFGSINDEIIPLNPPSISISIRRTSGADVNGDGVVNILDLIRVAQSLGKRDANMDVNGDGIVNIFDLTLVAQGIAGAAAPAVATGRADAATVESWIALARLEDDGSIAFRQGIANLENLLASLIIPQETALHANYPNPFNPETWIPYQLAAPSEVVLTIYAMNGGVVRRLEMGHQAAGLYRNRSRAAYWDGRNERGESVASGVYFYTLRAGQFSATRKMLIMK